MTERTDKDYRDVKKYEWESFEDGMQESKDGIWIMEDDYEEVCDELNKWRESFKVERIFANASAKACDMLRKERDHFKLMSELGTQNQKLLIDKIKDKDWYSSDEIEEACDVQPRDMTWMEIEQTLKENRDKS